MLHERLVFRHFWTVLALGGGVAEWIVICCVGRMRPPLALHLAGPLLLALVNRLAAGAFEDDTLRRPLARRVQRVVFAVGFCAMAGAGALAATAAAWTALGLAGALRAEAGVVGGEQAIALFGSGFHAFALAVVGLGMGTMAYGYARGQRRIVVEYRTVEIDGLPPALTDLRLVHLSDIHLGPIADVALLREAIARTNALAPDVVCVTGDIVDTPSADLERWLPELARLWARHGVLAILGNHDLYAGGDRVAEATSRLGGWTVLRDRVFTLDVDGSRLHVVGLEDHPDGPAAEVLATLLERVPASEPAILLAHRPGVFPAAAAAGVPLTLAGHTHGGQVAMPGIPRLNVARLLLTRFDAGWFTRGRALLHVSRGLGTSGQPVRVGAPREITLLTLVPATAARAVGS